MMERLLIPIPEKGYYVPNKQGLRDEILTIVSEGNDTTGISNMVTIFNIINSPEIHSSLLAELKTVMPTLQTRVPYPELERLPYLVCRMSEVSERYISHLAANADSSGLHIVCNY